MTYHLKLADKKSEGYLPLTFWLPLTLVCRSQALKLHSYTAKGSKKQSKSEPKVEMLKLQNEGSLKK